jgi:hypothetical protein
MKGSAWQDKKMQVKAQGVRQKVFSRLEAGSQTAEKSHRQRSD